MVNEFHGDPDREAVWNLRLYVAGQTPRSLLAFVNLKRICEEHLAGHYQIDVVDLAKNPELAAGDGIFAIPSLVRRLPEPVKQERNFLPGTVVDLQ